MACMPADCMRPCNALAWLQTLHTTLTPSSQPPLHAGLHFAIFGALASWSAGFAAAIALNWARGRLSLPKCGVLLALACYDRVWLYWLWLTAKLIDSGLAKLAPPLRKFMWWVWARCVRRGARALRS